ncbi:hypothetical protein [Leptolyngbya ohadii]|uniref:hypothetical protein n=1 Tax=Leptolyngbya ohadii TaxID=1962290 RepID=UPI000B5A1163|nr:hypothetical protein [Leptolyngbya ohadii]
MMRSQQIANIIEKRQPLVKRIENAEIQLQRLGLELQTLEQERNDLSLRGELDDPEIRTQLKQINFTAIQLQIKDELEVLRKLKQRFSRATLNIGVVGRARQGKSRLLQSLTGLSTVEIPDGELLQCTGVRSTIYHDPDTTTYAEVVFHSEQSFLEEIIAPYYKQLGLGIEPKSLQAFASNPPQAPSQKSSESNAKYEHLCKYYQHLDKYQSLISSGSIKIESSQIREYVAQDTIDGKGVYYNYLAVKEVRIFCPFPNEEVGRLALVDMPGLGDTGIGDSERMIRTLGQDIDFVLFVRRPRMGGDDWFDFDTQLYDTANKALVELPIEDWSFMVLNRDANNSVLCEIFAEKMQVKHIKVKRTIIANCADAREANDEILSAVLDYLVNRIDVLDYRYSTACFDRVSLLQQQTDAAISKFSNIIESFKSEDGMEEFNERFSAFWDAFPICLEDLLTELIEKRDCEDYHFRQDVEKLIQSCRNDRTIVPDQEEIERMNKRYEGYRTAYEKSLQNIRTQLSIRFLSLEIGLNRSLEEIKMQVVGALADQGLGGLAAMDSNGTVAASEFLKAVADLIPEKQQKIKFGFQLLADFDLVYRGLIQHRIRKHLDVLTPNKTKYKLEANFFDGLLGKGQSPTERIVSNLTQAYTEAVNNCEEELKKLLREPSQAGFAIVEEFVDRVIRAKGVENEWRDFLWRERSKVWVDAFRRMKTLQELQRNARDLAERVKATNNANHLSELHTIG